MPTKRLVPPPAYTPPLCDDSDAAALRAMQAGNANPNQQRQALAWIVNLAAGAYDQPFRPGAADETAFACGRMFVGQQIVHQINFVRVKPKITKDHP